MLDFVKVVIESSFAEDELILPKQGEGKIEVKNEVGEIIIRFKADKFLIDEEKEAKEIVQKVLLIFH
jgi:hypothetical protein